MSRFMDGEIDVLLSTSIIESGLDNGRANTTVVWNADRFGLAQLHQLRGRVGRSGEPAHIVLLTKIDLKEGSEAATRLNAFGKMSDVGSGFYIARMRNVDRQSKPIMEKLIVGLSPLPSDARQSITFNCGSEFAAWRRLKSGIEADSWFRDPSAPSRNIAARYPDGQCVAQRNSRKHQQSVAKVFAPINGTDGPKKSIFEVHLPAPQFHPAQVLRVQNAR